MIKKEWPRYPLPRGSLNRTYYDTRVIPLMRRANGTEPVFEATDDFLKTTLFRGVSKSRELTK